MLLIKLIFLVFAIHGTCVVAETSLCRIPDNEPIMKYTLGYKGELVVRCEADYHFIPSGSIKCVNQKWIGHRPACAKKGCPTHIVQPKGGFISLTILYKDIVCYGGYILAGNEYSYCNGTHWDRPLGTCLIETEDTKYECDFETSEQCRWFLKGISHSGTWYSWTREIAIDTLGSFSAGPPHDHTTMSANGGHYMVLKSRGRSGIDVPLFSPYYDSTISSKNACFSFYYFMYGEGVNSLSVYIRPRLMFWNDLLGSE